MVTVNHINFGIRSHKALWMCLAALSTISLICAHPVAAEDDQPLLPVGNVAPAFHITTRDGKTVRLKDLRGKVVVLDFWATWCGPCRPTMKTLQALQLEYGSRLAIIGVCLDDEMTADAIKPMLQRFGVTYRITASYKQSQTVKSSYRVPGAGLLYMIDEHGIIRWSHASTGDDDSLVKQRVAAAVD